MFLVALNFSLQKLEEMSHNVQKEEFRVIRGGRIDPLPGGGRELCGHVPHWAQLSRCHLFQRGAAKEGGSVHACGELSS